MKATLDLKPFPFTGEGFERPLIIAGPCSAETEDQVLETAKELAKHNVRIFRAGIWKPRTRPNSFEGVGSVGLSWLKRVKEETGMLVATEVANMKHAYEALKYGVDILWIGARTSANPFAVQEIADTLKGTDIPVLVKNPVNPDLELWIGALERLNKAGITKLAAIHRGFSSFDNSVYRNTPQWQIPIELRRRLPQLPIITDPSHISGNRKYLLEISQKAMDLDFDGLIIESHIHPEEALSDASQQLTPDDLQQLINKLVLRKPDPTGEALVTLEELRVLIDKYDDEIMTIFDKRMKVAEDIGRYKKANAITILQTKRWDEILNKRVGMGQKMGLSAEFIETVYKAIHIESINHQNAIMNENEEEKIQ